MGVQLGPRHCVDEGPRVRRGLRSPVVVRSLLTDDSVPVAIAHASVRRVRPPDRRPVAWQTPRPGALGPSPSCCRTTCAPPRPARIDAHEFISSRCPDVRADSSQRRCPPTPSSPEFHSLYGHSASCRVTPRWSSGRTGQERSAGTSHAQYPATYGSSLGAAKIPNRRQTLRQHLQLELDPSSPSRSRDDDRT